MEINDFNNGLIKIRFDNSIVGFVCRNSPEKRSELFLKS